MGSLNSSLKVGSLIWFCLKWLKIRKSDDKICLFEKVGIGARSENIHTYKTIGSLVIGLCRFLRVTSRRLLRYMLLLQCSICNLLKKGMVGINPIKTGMLILSWSSLLVLWRNKSYCINLLNLPVHLLKNLRPLFSKKFYSLRGTLIAQFLVSPWINIV
ncbi:hypothetical protein AABB24_007901 [Solanum stoloniferum]|uniref:Uncharacterized protein n=1 Tax=Solanum stoloniferum TaxID=62892 RepID=A0ABD2UR93_9SOLN